MEVIGPDWLQGGALAILLIVLVPVGLWTRDRLKKDAERLQDQDAYVKGLLKEAHTERAMYVASWRTMVESDIKTREENIAAMRETNRTMEQLHASMKRQCAIQDVRHSEILTALKAK